MILNAYLWAVHVKVENGTDSLMIVCDATLCQVVFEWSVISRSSVPDKISTCNGEKMTDFDILSADLNKPIKFEQVILKYDQAV